MLINGSWHLCDDGLVRPVIVGETLAGDGSWDKIRFLVDTGADRTVFSAEVLESLQLVPVYSPDRLTGIGGMADSVVVETQIRFTQDDGRKVVFRGQFGAFTDVASLDMSVLGRDIINSFALIVDRQADTVCLLGQKHGYTIVVR